MITSDNFIQKLSFKFKVFFKLHHKSKVRESGVAPCCTICSAINQNESSFIFIINYHFIKFALYKKMKRVSNRISKRSSTRQTKDFNDYDELGNAIDDNATMETQDMLRNIFIKSLKIKDGV